MSASTNPFAAALATTAAGQQGAEAGAASGHAAVPPEEQQQEHRQATLPTSSSSTNPFANISPSANTHSRQQSLSSSPSTNPFQTQPSFASTPFSPSPFAGSAMGDGATQNAPFASGHQDVQAYNVQSNADSVTNPFANQSQTAQPESADAITASLSGLDFGASAAPAGASKEAASPTPEQPRQQSFEPQVQPQAQFTAAATPEQPRQQSSEPQVQPPAQFTAASTPVYAPPPGPPPGQAEEPSAVNQVQQLESDEAYARRIWEKDSERQRRRQERRRQSSGAGGVAAAVSPRQDDSRLRGKRRQQSNGDAVANAAAGGVVPATNGHANTAASDEEKQWNTKEVYWRNRSQRIVVQNENGPCSLIALCNVLLLRGDVAITPEDRPAVSYSYLASLLGEHLIDVISTKADAALDLEAALSILPQTQHGLDVNVKFSAIDGFVDEELASDPTAAKSGEYDLLNLQDQGSSSAGASSSAAPAAASSAAQADKGNAPRGELALFKLCNVPLVHGWLADQSDAETWEAVVGRAGDYDKALDRVVAGNELTKGDIVQGEEGNDASGALAAAVENLSPDDARVVNDAFLIRRFLESTATQLTYPGLYALSTTLARGSLYALFRNSHLSVLYRPTEEELLSAANASALEVHNQPQLYQLVTDATLENEDGIVWESVEDVDGSASRFYDGKFRLARVQEDFVGRRQANGVGADGAADEDADFAYAQHLQQQEHMRADRHRQAWENRRTQRHQQRPQQQGGAGAGNGGGLLARMLAKRKAGKPQSSYANNGDHQALDQQIHQRMGGGSVSQGTAQHNRTDDDRQRVPGSADPAASSPGAADNPNGKKWWKKVFPSVNQPAL